MHCFYSLKTIEFKIYAFLQYWSLSFGSMYIKIAPKVAPSKCSITSQQFLVEGIYGELVVEQLFFPLRFSGILPCKVSFFLWWMTYIIFLKFSPQILELSYVSTTLQWLCIQVTGMRCGGYVVGINLSHRIDASSALIKGCGHCNEKLIITYR